MCDKEKFQNKKYKNIYHSKNVLEQRGRPEAGPKKSRFFEVWPLDLLTWTKCIDTIGVMYFVCLAPLMSHLGSHSKLLRGQKKDAPWLLASTYPARHLCSSWVFRSHKAQALSHSPWRTHFWRPSRRLFPGHGQLHDQLAQQTAGRLSSSQPSSLSHEKTWNWANWEGERDWLVGDGDTDHAAPPPLLYRGGRFRGDTR